MSLKSATLHSRITLPAFAIQGMYWGAFAALVPPIKGALGASDGAFGLAMLASAFGAVTAMACAPLIERRLGLGALPLLSALIVVPFFAASLAPDLLLFTIAITFAGASAGALDVVMNTRVSRNEELTGAPLMNLNHAIFSLAYAVAAAATGFARDAGQSAPTVFLACGVATLLLTLGTIERQPPPRLATEDDTEAGQRRVRAFWPVVLLAGLMTLLAFMMENATEGWSALHIERSLGGGATEGGLGPAMLGLTMTIGRLGGQVLTRAGAELRIAGWAGLMTAAGAWIAAAAPGIPVAYLGFGLLGFGVSVIGPLAISWAGARVPPERRAEAVSRVVMMGFSGFFVGPPLMGLVSEAFGLATAFAVAGSLVLLVPVLAIWLSRLKPVRA